MFLPFKISTSQIEELLKDKSADIGYSSVYNELERKVKKQLPVENIKNSFINGSRLQEEWFPTEDNCFHVFLSHSSRDTGIVKKFSYWLKSNLGLDCFIDSVYWKYSNQLLREIDDEWCKYYSKSAKQYLYKYNNRNFSTSNIHCMLTMALVRMMSRCECVIFIDSENSIQYKFGEDVNKTCSPWIYEEIEMAQQLRWVVPERMIRSSILDEHKIQKCFSLESEQPTFYYDVVLKDFIPLSASVLSDIKRYVMSDIDGGKGEPALDKLYEIYLSNDAKGYYLPRFSRR